MAADMTIAMSLWMRYRKHSWISIAEMAAAMVLPFAILFVPLWAVCCPWRRCSSQDTC